MAQPEASTDDPSPSLPRWQAMLRSTFAVGAVGSLLAWFAQAGTARLIGLPDGSLSWLAWLAPATWAWLILHPETFARRHTIRVWLAGVVYWMLTLYWVCYPHPLTRYGWPILCAFLALYFTLFVLLARRLVHRAGAPVWIAAPVVWVGLEFVMAHLFTGFHMGVLSQTQAAYPLVIQVSDLTGEYGVSFVLVMVGAAIAFALRRDRCRVQRAAGVVTTALVAGAMLGYGYLRLAEPVDAGQGPVVALIQGKSLAIWDPDPGRSQLIMDDHTKLTRQAVKQAQADGITIDLVVWPESMFRAPVVTHGVGPANASLPFGSFRQHAKAHRDWVAGITGETNAALLIGADRFDYPNRDGSGDPTIYNSAIMADQEGQMIAFYDKTHLVPFGEYIPFAKNVPALYYMTPMSGGLGAGKGPVAMDHGGVTYVPSICYESVMPHVIRRHLAKLIDQGQTPDVLVNVTNDAWFWGATELDMHLACDQFRAVENRRPMVIAANTGLSAIVDGSGRVLHVSQRMQEDVIVARAPLDGRESFYTRHGDWFALGCFLVSIVWCFVKLPRKNCDT